MDSGLGSDDEKRNRTKAQKQLQNEQKQLFSGCFIDATSLGDEGEFESRRSDERRQGALIFRSSIPQYSMLQMPHVMVEVDHVEQGESCGGGGDDLEEDRRSNMTDTATPHNSIVQVEAELGKKTPVGFFVDLGDLGDELEEAPAAPVEKKNIFSMIIDYNVPKREMPSRLSTSLYGRRKQDSAKTTPTSSSCRLNEDVASCGSDSGRDRSRSVELCDSDDKSDKGGNEFVSLPSVEAKVVVDNKTVGRTDSKHQERAKGAECGGNRNGIDHRGGTKVADSSRLVQQFVRLSDLEEQAPRLDLFLAPRMSRSIPEKSWVESPLATFRSASYRSSPQPFQPERTEPFEASSADSSSPPPRRSVQRLGTDLLRMFLEEIGPDVTVEVNGRKLRAHRCILSSRCQYFAAVLGGSGAEDVVSIQGYSYAAVHFALCHIYSGAAHIPQSISLVELAALSDMLGLEGLKEVVAHAFKVHHCHNFHKPCTGCVGGVLEVLPLSAAYGLDELYQDALRWITRHFVEVWSSRAFANLPRELREKCYQQHVVHMAPDSVLGTTLSCDKLLATMPTAKWAEPVAQLALQLADHCQVYLRQNFAAVLATPGFGASDSIGQLEESLVTAAGALKLDQACRSYINCHKMLQQHKNSTTAFADVLRRIYAQIETCVVRQAAQASRSNVWTQLDPVLRKRIRDLSAKFAAKPKVDSGNLQHSSSSDSSRNSSPAIKGVAATPRTLLHSPSLRRSLLIAARTSQTPPSPSTTRRISTLTNPTQSSAARSAAVISAAPSRKPPGPTNKSTNKPSAVIQRTPAPPPPAKKPLKREPPQKENQRKRGVSTSNVTRADKGGASISKARPNSANACTTKRPLVAPKQVASPEKQSPGMQRSGTFLKEEPTVLGKLK